MLKAADSRPREHLTPRAIVKLTIDLDNGALIRGLVSPIPLPFNRLELKSTTSGPLEWIFVRPFIAAEELAEEDADVTLKFGVKEILDPASDFLVSNWNGTAFAHTLTGTGADAVYSTPITWDSVALRALLNIAIAAGADFVDCAGALKILVGDTVRETLNFTVRIFAAYISGTEGQPQSPTPDYPAADELALRTIAGKYRIKADGTFQLWNADQSLFHTLTLSGDAGEETLNIAAGES
jgi:hypothetical protein